MEKTLVIIKPDAVCRGYSGRILSLLEENGLRLQALKMLQLSKQQAQGFYQVHRERYFFDSLTSYMSSGPIIAMVLEGEGAIDQVRQLMGATDPKEAAPDTIRARFGQNREQNAIHGSDSPESAAFEIPFIFNELELMAYK
jgi:nucleoside-diphosphate kinase